MRNNCFDIVLGSTGRTLYVKLGSISKGLKANIYSKLDYMNLGGSVKDRIARYMIEKAEREIKLKPGDVILDNFYGNTANALSIDCRKKGYKIKIVIRDTASTEKIKMLGVLGVDVIKVDASLLPEHPESCYQYAYNLVKDDFSLSCFDQHNNLDNSAHFVTTGPEIWKQMNGKIDYLIDEIGTGGTIISDGKYLKEKNSNIRVCGINTVGSIFYKYFKGKKLIKPSRSLIEGIGDEPLIKTTQLDLLDDMYQIESKIAIEWTKNLHSKKELLQAARADANILGAVKLANEIN
ncbi:PLP-dependent cysteine synthase family protein [Melioribacter sp. OK-6-Me]|uniref:PLP-dependent cysteine synthase family protein n=1 Tax=unclassified Melioribacter TaxID=2627329 RepID=UPI003EDAB97B